ncbi:hypothetical protein [Sulfurimonas sp. HSL-1716]|uniref:hypothetical protein n=1 Tax=Hydrocurvibacter sulfurireducens TaxID=3131937 RepID=UPI0031FA1FB2
MFIIKGKQLHIFTSADFTNKETGETVKGKVKLQLLVQTPLRNGEIRNELIDISIPKEKYNLYKDKTNSMVEVEVGVIGKCSYYGI